MSLAMREARYAVGDPGLFGFLGNVAKVAVGGITGLATGGPLGAAAGILSGIRQPKSIKTAIATAGMNPITSAILTRRATPTITPAKSTTMFPQLPAAPPGFSGVSIGGGAVQVGTSRPGLGVAPSQGVTGSVVGAGAGTPCQAGYHYNKARYYSTRYGVVEKGSVCVKNRRRNPLNPRALSRAMSRVKSAQRAVKCLQLFAGPAARASAKARPGARRGGCGGKCRK